MVSKWRMSGSLLGECNCDWGCPCSFDAPPTHGGCRGVYTWVIDKGAYGDVKLDGLGVALPGIWPGAVHLGHGTQLVLIDGRATPAQRKALEPLGKGRGRRPVRRVRFRHGSLAAHDRGAIRRPAQRDPVDGPCRRGKGLRPGPLEDQEPRDG